MKYDAIILGAGASGLFCASTALLRGKKILLLDHAEKPGLKVAISGGGKCNYSNTNVSPAQYHGQNPHFTISALERLTCDELTNRLTNAGIAVEEREHGQLFCRHSARDMVRFLIDGIGGPESPVLVPSVKIVEVSKDEGGFSVTFEKAGRENTVKTKNLVIATGNIACPQAGATDFGLRLAKQFRHRLIQTFPALVGLVMPASWPFADLSGIGIPANIRLLGQDGQALTPAENLPLLFTHKGISGPAALQTSLYWEKGDALSLDFLPGQSLTQLLNTSENTKLLLKTLFKRLFADRLAMSLLAHAEQRLFLNKNTSQHPKNTPNKLPLPMPLAGIKVGGLSAATKELLAQTVHAFTIRPERTEGLKKAEVARGGVDTRDVSSRTMESRLVPGLYFCGEVLDVTGRLGGFNLHWAFASGQAAGEAI